MYSPEEPKPACPLNPRDFVDLLDELIKLRIGLSQYTTFDQRNWERCEIIKHQLTDYLLEIDKRPGVYVKGAKE